MIVTKILTAICLLGFVLYIVSSDAGQSFVLKYLLYVVSIGPFLGFRITPVEMGGLSLFDAITLLSIPVLFTWQKWKIDLRTGYFALAATFFTLILIGSLISEFPLISLTESIKYFTILVFGGCLMYQITLDKDFVFTLLGRMRISAAFAITFLILQMVFGLGFSFFEPSANAYLYDAQVRYPGMFTDPQQNAQFLAMSSFLFLAGYRNHVDVLLRYILFAVTLLAIFFTGVRAAFLGVIAGMIILSVFGNTRFRLASFFALIVGVLAFYFFKDSIVLFNRDISAGEMSGIRFEYWKAAIELFKSHTWMGIGVGNYQPFVSVFDQNQYWESMGEFEYVVHPESGYLKLLVELGLFNSIIFIAFILQPIFASVTAWFQATGERKDLVLILAAATICWAISFVTVFSFADVRIMVLVTTLLVALHSLRGHNQLENA